MGVSSAFLNAKIDREIYLHPAPDFPCGHGKRYLLKRALYGLEQSDRLWFETFSELFRNLGYQQLRSDQCVLVRGAGAAAIILALWVDDCLILGADGARIRKAKDQLKSVFKMTDNGVVSLLLVIMFNLDPDTGAWTLSQQGYILSLLGKFTNDGGDGVARHPGSESLTA